MPHDQIVAPPGPNRDDDLTGRSGYPICAATAANAKRRAQIVAAIMPASGKSRILFSPRPDRRHTTFFGRTHYAAWRSGGGNAGLALASPAMNGGYGHPDPGLTYSLPADMANNRNLIWRAKAKKFFTIVEQDAANGRDWTSLKMPGSSCWSTSAPSRPARPGF